MIEEPMAITTFELANILLIGNGIGWSLNSNSGEVHYCIIRLAILFPLIKWMKFRDK